MSKPVAIIYTDRLSVSPELSDCQFLRLHTEGLQNKFICEYHKSADIIGDMSLWLYYLNCLKLDVMDITFLATSFAFGGADPEMLFV